MTIQQQLNQDHPTTLACENTRIQSTDSSKQEEVEEEEKGKQQVTKLNAKEEVVIQEEDSDDLATLLTRDLTEEHIKLLYLVSKYSHVASSSQEKEKWIRSVPLLVLIYEGVVNKVFDYDYAPSTMVVKNRHIYMNISQEGRDDIDDLREQDLINGLKLSSRRYQPITAYQISTKGKKVLSILLTSELQQEVDNFYDCETGKHYSNLLNVEWSGEKFNLIDPVTGVIEQSTVTDCEDVSYVSSPYLPACLHSNTGVNTMTSNAHLVNEFVCADTNIRDELDEIIHLSDCCILIGEWVPFGSNQVAALNSKLGASERVKGGLFTSIVDDNPEDTQFEMTTGLTKVKILDFEHAGYLNFEAEVNFPEDEGIVQIESFGVHCSEDGFICCGLFIESIIDRMKEKVSLDLLSRLLIDIHQDSSKILDSLLSIYQRGLLNVMFAGDSLNRDKFSAFLAKGIVPKLRAEEFMDKEAHENELKQVIGDTQSAHDLTDDLILIIGGSGLILAGPDSKKYENIIVSYLSLTSRELFLENFFYRLFSLNIHLGEIRKMIHDYGKDPNSIQKIRKALSDASSESILMSEILSFLRESIEFFDDFQVDEFDPVAVNMVKILSIEKRKVRFSRRVRDLEKNVDGTSHALGTLREMTDVISETQMFRVQEALQNNTKNLEQVFRANERASSSLEVLQIILGGTLAFELLDRVTGGWSVVDSTDWGKEWIQEPFINRPGLWFAINIGLWVIIGYVLVRIMSHLANSSSGVLHLSIKVNMGVSPENLRRYLSTKVVQEEHLDIDSGGSRIKKATWQEEDSEKWLGCPPKIDITYDTLNHFLLKVFLQIDKRSGTLRENQLEEIFMEDLYKHGVITEKFDAKSSVSLF